MTAGKAGRRIEVERRQGLGERRTGKEQRKEQEKLSHSVQF